MESYQSILHIGWLQLDIQWHHPEKNLKRIETIASSIPSSLQALILPEMFTTGFTMEPANCGETMDGSTVQWMKRFAQHHDIFVGGSVVINTNGSYVNRFIGAYPDGKIAHYDKRHLFNHAGEGDHYQMGTERRIVEYLGWKIMPLICYDLRFPVWSRNNIDYDLLVYVANWPEPRIHHWDHLILARAIENQCFTLGVNRTGVDGNQLSYVGHSGLASFDGTWIEHAGSKEGVYHARIDKQTLHEYRQSFNFLKDQDRFQIQ